MINYISYEEYKFIKSIIFNTTDDLNNTELIKSLEFLDQLKIVLEPLCKGEWLSFSVKSHLYNVLSNARNIKDDNTVNRINKVNEIIRMLNLQINDKSDNYYRRELFSRRGKSFYLDRRFDITSQIDSVHKSILSDFLVVNTHNEKNVSRKDFIEKKLPYFLKHITEYYESVNFLLDENKILFKDKEFYDRVKLVFSEYYKKTSDESVEKLNKIFIKQIDNRINKA